jgi:hypothetical protein
MEVGNVNDMPVGTWVGSDQASCNDIEWEEWQH